MSFKIKNFSMRAFNNDVNNSTDPGDKYKAWAQYRNDVTGFIRSAVSKDSRAKSILVFGAGECNDLDLGFLASTFERIVLTDVDAQSIYDGMARQGVADTSRFEVLQTEYTGLESAGFFDTLSALCSESAPEEQISSFIKSALQNVMSPNMSKLLGGEFDFVLSCPIYTQIVFTQAEVLMEILAHYSTYSHSDMHALLECVSESIPALIKKYNDLLLSVLSQKGRAIVLTDIIEAHPSGELVQTILKILSSRPVDDHALEHLVRDHGLKFGMIGRDDLFAKTDETDCLWALWPFDEHRHYLVYGIFAHRK